MNQNYILNKILYEISNEDKKYLILNFSNISTNNSKFINNKSQKKLEINKQQLYYRNNFFKKNKSYKFIKPKCKELINYDYNKVYRLPSGAEKKKNFYYI